MITLPQPGKFSRRHFLAGTSAFAIAGALDRGFTPVAALAQEEVHQA
jgi:hypothetical protein